MLREEAEEVVHSLKARKSGADNIPAELLKNEDKETTAVLTVICQMIWETMKRPKEWIQSLIIHLPKRGIYKQCQNYHTISLMSYPSQIML